MTTTDRNAEAERDRCDRGTRRIPGAAGRRPDPAPAPVPAAQARPRARRGLRSRRRAATSTRSPSTSGRPRPACGDDAVRPTVQQFPVDPKLPHLDTVMCAAAQPALAAALESTARRFTTCRSRLAPAGRRRRARPVQAGGPLRAPLPAHLRRPPSERAARTRTCTLVAKLYREERRGAGRRRPPDPAARPGGGRLDRTPARRRAGAAAGADRGPREQPRSRAGPVRAGRRASRVRGRVRGDRAGRRGPRRAAHQRPRHQRPEPAHRGRRGREGGQARGCSSSTSPNSAPVVRRVAGTLCAALAGLPTDVLRPAHGSYKASQLMVRDGAVFLVDFDQFCLADPALDVGYFLAYLRPAGLWYHRAGRRAWFEAAAETFRTAYLRPPRRAGRVRGHRCAASPAAPRCTRPRCCSRSRRGGPTGCTARAPERWRRCSTRSPAASRRRSRGRRSASQRVSPPGSAR